MLIQVHDILQVFKRFVEIGRVALINTGPNEGKLCVIIDVIDQRRVSNCPEELHLCSVRHLVLCPFIHFRLWLLDHRVVLCDNLLTSLFSTYWT